MNYEGMLTVCVCAGVGEALNESNVVRSVQWVRLVCTHTSRLFLFVRFFALN